MISTALAVIIACALALALATGFLVWLGRTGHGVIWFARMADEDNRVPVRVPVQSDR